MAGAGGGASVSVAWDLATGADPLTKDLAVTVMQGAMTGATTGSSAAKSVAAKTYDDLVLAKLQAEVKAASEKEESRGPGDRSALAIETDIQNQIKEQDQVKRKMAALGDLS